MKNRNKTIIILTVIYVLAMIGIITAKSVQGKEPEPTFRSICTKVSEPDGEWWNGGHLYIVKKGVMQFGWVRWKGNTYYCHKTGSNKYPVGSATRGEMRVRKGKFIAFKGSTGQRITKDYYVRKGRFKKRLSLKMNRDGSVRYVYNTSACFGYRRYSTKERRYQEEQLDGTWKTVGMQFWPDYIDWQE